MMQNRLYLSNYLLSGDTREVERMNEGLRTLTEKLQQGKSLSNSEQERTALAKVEQLEQAWGKEFTLKHYHDSVLAYGSPPVRYVRELMLELPIQ